MAEENKIRKMIREAIHEALEDIFKPKDRICYLDSIDLKKVPIEELKKQYVDYRLERLADGFGSPISKLAEGLTYASAKKTAQADRVVLEMTVKYGLNKQWQIKKRIAENNVPIIIAVADIGENSYLIESDFANAGYFLGFNRAENIDGMKWKILQFEPIHQEDNTDEIRKNNIAYHWSPSYNKAFILKNGFIPSSNNNLFSYPPRVHFMCGTCTNQELTDIGRALCEANSDKRNNGNYSLFYIDTTEIPEDVKFYYDPNMPNAMYTYNELPISVILNVREYKLKRNYPL